MKDYGSVQGGIPAEAQSAQR